MKKNALKPLYWALVKRRDEVQGAYVVLSKLLQTCGMSSYIYSATRRILELENTEHTVYTDHTIIDFYRGDVWLDKYAYKYFKEILLGYLSLEDYNRIDKWLEFEDGFKQSLNNIIRFYKNKTIQELFSLIKASRNLKSKLPSEAKMMRNCAFFEIASRTPLIAFLNHRHDSRLKRKTENLVQGLMQRSRHYQYKEAC